MFKHVLIATDGSSLSKKVEKEGAKLAKSMGARATVVHVYPAHYGIAVDVQTQNRLRRTAREEGEKYLERACRVVESHGTECQPVLLENDNPWKGIINTARKKRCDVIIMAAHGRRGLSALVLGSETNKVLVNSKLPVLVYR